MASAIKPVEPARNVFLVELERRIGRASNMYRAMAYRPEVLERALQTREVTLVAALANFTNRFNNGLGIEPEE